MGCKGMLRMHTPTSSRWRRLAILGLAGLAISSSQALSAATLPDLLELPAARHERSAQSVQLAIARAGTRLVSVGERGVVVLSDDDGKTWRQAQRVPVSVALTNVAFANENTGWIVGHSGIVLRSDDGGETWRVLLDGVQAANRVLDDAQQRVDLAGEDEPTRALAERELGNAQRLVEDGPDKPFLALAFADDKRGWIVGAYGLALATEDGGETWNSIVGKLPNRGAMHLYSIQYRQGQLLLAGEQGLLIRSDDDGASFTRIESPYEGTFFGVLADEAGLIAYGLRGNVWTQDAAGEWSQVGIPQPITFTAALRRADGSVVLADEAGHLYVRSSGDTHFEPLRISAPTGLTGLVESSDGVLVASATRGALRLLNGEAR